MRCKWYFRNEPTENFSVKPGFNVKSNWNPPNVHPALETFLSKLENEVFFIWPGTPRDYIICRR